MIKLPSHLWFMGLISFRGPGNTYSGSVGCDPALGNINENSFRYVVRIEKQDEALVLKAQHYLGPNAIEATDRSIITERIFESSPEGVDEAQAWLNEAAEQFIKNNEEKTND